MHCSNKLINGQYDFEDHGHLNEDFWNVIAFGKRTNQAASCNGAIIMDPLL